MAKRVRGVVGKMKLLDPRVTASKKYLKTGKCDKHDRFMCVTCAYEVGKVYAPKVEHEPDSLSFMKKNVMDRLSELDMDKNEE